MNLLSVRNLLGGVTLSLGILLSIGNANAHTFDTTKTFRAIVDFSDPTSLFVGIEGSGSFSYDSTHVSGTGISVLFLDDPLNGPDFSFTIDIFDQIFTEADDLDFDFFPVLTFEDGVAIDFALFVDEEEAFDSFGNFIGDNFTSIIEEGIRGFDVFGFDQLSGEEFDFEAFVTVYEFDTLPGPGGTEVSSVPEPGALALFGIGLLGLGLMRRRRSL